MAAVRLVYAHCALQLCRGTSWTLSLELLEAAYGGQGYFHEFDGNDYDAPVDEGLHTYMLGDTTYGEVTPSSVITLFEQLDVQPSQRFYDLGSGAGKMAAMAWCLFGLQSTGIEFVEERHDIGCLALAQLEKMPKDCQRLCHPHLAGSSLQLVHGSFLELDLCDADLVFMNSITWDDQLLSALSSHLNCLQAGSRIVTYSFRGSVRSENDSSIADAPAADFRRLRSVALRGSWQRNSTTRYEVLQKVSQAQLHSATGLRNTSSAEKTCKVSAKMRPDRDEF